MTQGKDYLSELLERLENNLEAKKEKLDEVPTFGMMAVPFRKDALILQHTIDLLEKEWNRQRKKKKIDWQLLIAIYQELSVEYNKFTQFLSQPGVYVPMDYDVMSKQLKILTEEVGMFLYKDKSIDTCHKLLQKKWIFDNQLLDMLPEPIQKKAKDLLGNNIGAMYDSVVTSLIWSD
ncbi:hypothetical protein HBP98_16945 [Listeria booriae]|uniref:Uncharacterized protein n=1 Tax=Listeria booriae TaxID=1552123 RepID=A0A7X1AAY9_9LIST|nr:hypothetical protein [Listeria booriae]MBC2373701.1 hypothetical protein [Listeria booriae]